MRMMLKYELDLAAANQAVRDGTIAEINEQLVAAIRPEATYFGTENGRRTGYLVFDMTDSAQIPAIAEPLFQRVGASVVFIPVMDADDLRRGLAALPALGSDR